MPLPELLAPAGSYESLTAALRCGADAVYVGGKTFSARQNAANFDTDELEKAADLCHLYGKKLYVTVNTIIFDSQVREFVQAIKTAVSAGADAFIVQDAGAADIIKSVCPEARLHASTQMTVHSPAGALFAKKLGFKRVVLSRELSAKQIAEISSLGIETEIFVHGALCMSVSGQCYLSAVIGQRSANRGLCAQPCRLTFSAAGNRNSCALSLKDLSLAEHTDEIINSGVTSLKIEGRMKRPEYVAAAVSSFRNALEGKPYDMELLRAVFSRSGFTDGYFTGKRNDMFGTREKEDVTSAKTVFPEIHKLYRTERKVSGIHFSAEIKNDSPLRLTASDDSDNSVSVTGNVPQKAINKPVNCEFLERQLSKLGDTVYSLDEIEAVIDDGLSVSAGELNELRRRAVSELNSLRIEKNTFRKNISGRLPEIPAEYHSRKRHIRARIADLKHLNAALSADMIIIPLELLCADTAKYADKIIAEPPRFISDEKKLRKNLECAAKLGFKRLMCNNAAYIQIGAEYGFELYGDFGLNVANSYSAGVLAESGLESITLSFELKLSQAQALTSPIPKGIIAYGRLPVMLTANCPVKNETGCGKCRKELTDRTGRSFKIACHGGYTELLNSQVLYLADKLDELKGMDFLTLYFTDETPSEISDIIDSYKNGGAKKENITRGLYYRGVL